MNEMSNTAYFASKSYIEKNSEIIQKFTNAIYKGQLWVESHTPEEIAQAIKPHFPDTDARFKGADSTVLLAEAGRRVQAQGWQIGNIDSTVVAQAPRLAPHLGAMVQRIAQALELAPEQVNVKAKTAERLGPVGQGAAMEAQAVALLFV